MEVLEAVLANVSPALPNGVRARRSDISASNTELDVGVFDVTGNYLADGTVHFEAKLIEQGAAMDLREEPDALRSNFRRLQTVIGIHVLEALGR